MKTLKKKKLIIYNSLLLALAALLLAGGVFGAARLNRAYRDDALEAQTRQLTSVTASLASGFRAKTAFYSEVVGNISAKTMALDDAELISAMRAAAAKIDESLGAEVAIFDEYGVSGISTDEKTYRLLPEDFARLQGRESGVPKTPDAALAESGGELFLAFRAVASGRAAALLIPAGVLFESVTERVHVGRDGYVMLIDTTYGNVFYASKTGSGSTVRTLEELARITGGNGERFSGVTEDDGGTWLVVGESVRDTGGLFICGALDYSEISAPMRSRTLLLALYIAMMAAAALAVGLVAIGAARRNSRAREELELLTLKNEKLEEINRREAELAHLDRLREIGALSAGIAHEFNNLLTPIMVYSASIVEELPPGGECSENAISIYEAAQRAKEIVSKISFLSRRGMDATFSTLDFDAVVAKSVETAAIGKPKGLEFRADYGCAGAAVSGNETLLTQMFLNILINAMQSVGGEGTIFVKTRLSEDGKTVRAELGDTGRGIPAELLKSIFDPFFTTKEAGRGTGLGLSLSLSVAEGHKGLLRAENRPEGGALFIFEMPTAE